MMLYLYHYTKILHHFIAHWVALYIKEPCAEVQWIFALQESMYSTTAIHSFNATPLSQSNHLADQVDVEEKGL